MKIKNSVENIEMVVLVTVSHAVRALALSILLWSFAMLSDF